MKDLQKAIEKIVKEYSYFLGDADEYNLNMPKVIEELTQLVTSREQEIREEVDKDGGKILETISQIGKSIDSFMSRFKDREYDYQIRVSIQPVKMVYPEFDEIYLYDSLSARWGFENASLEIAIGEYLAQQKGNK